MSKWISIDLGTSNCSAAFWNGRHAEMIEFHDPRFPSGVSHQMPSAIAIDPETEEVSVGVEALENGKEHKGQWFYRYFKRRLGEQFHDAAESGQQTCVDPKTGLVAYVGPNGYVIPTVDLASYQIEEILKQAAKQLGEFPTNAVVTIPADCGDAQKAATLEAARKAGLTGRIELEHEPTMAALAFGYDFAKPRYIAVADHGAGTFDISIIQTGKGRNRASLVEVLVTDGRRKGLGGMDFDSNTSRYLVNRFRTTHRAPDEWPEHAARTRITDAAEKAKQDLSGREETRVFIAGIWRTPQGVDMPMDEVLDLKTFAAVNSDMATQIKAICQRAVDRVKEKDPKFAISDIQDVILVGGMTRSPVVRDAIRAVFNKEPRREINPEEAVALGGAIKTAILSGAITGVTVRDITSRAICVETVDDVAASVFPANTNYPVTKEVVIRNADDGQGALSVAILEGDSIYASECAILATHDHIISEPGPAKTNALKLIFKLDEGGRLSVESADGWSWRGAA